MLFAAFWKRNLGFFKLAVVTNLEYRLNFLIDALIQPMFTTGIEMLLWWAVFKSASSSTIGGFSREYYLSYALWAAFMARITISWMYEFRMIEEIDSGTINSLLVRPLSFYEYYFSQLMGYKFITTLFSFIFPVIVVVTFQLPTQMDRIPLAMTLAFYYLILIHSISFAISSLAFFYNKVYSLATAKNLLIWLLTGEMIPIDLMPGWLKSFLLFLPFSSGVFLPVGYITGRIGKDAIDRGFVSVTIFLVLVNLLGLVLWKRGLKSYVGTGA
jgi:ABC-2 type transport system permease protein